MSVSIPLDEDARLVQRLKRREPQAMADLYDRFSRLVYSIILRAVRDATLTEDLVQETFFRVWNRIQTFDDDRGRLEAWIATVARNRAVDHLRASRGPAAVNLSPLSPSESWDLFTYSESDAGRVESEAIVTRAMRSLNSNQREVIELTHFEGLTQTEIAERINKPVGTVKGLVRSALKVLRVAIEEGRQ